MQSIKENNRRIPEVPLRTSMMLYVVLFLVLCISGCGKKLDMDASRAEVEYRICPWGYIPKELQNMVDTHKKKAGTFSYNNSKYTYLVVCYGPQAYSGYSIQVMECSKGKDLVYLKTRLIGPAAGEPAVRKESWPYIVIRLDRWNGLCVMEP